MQPSTTLVRGMLERQRSASLRLLARWHPLSLEALASPRWNRHLLQLNPRLPWRALLEAASPPFELDHATLSQHGGEGWDEDLLERHERRWDYRALSANPKLPWSRTLIGRYAERWDWTALSGNRGLPFDAATLEAFADRWVVPRLAANTAVPWDAALVRRFASRLKDADPGWHPAMEFERPEAVAPGIQLMATGWQHLVQNPGVDWNEVLPLVPSPDWRLLSANEGLPWTPALLSRHAKVLVASTLCRNRALPWTAERIDRLLHGAEERLQLSGNPGLPWSESLLRRFDDRWAWRAISRNAAIPWTVGLLEAYGDRLDWDKLSSHGRLSAEILAGFADRLRWRAVSCNQAIPWTLELIEGCADRLAWERLSWHPRLPWGDALLVFHRDRWVVGSFERNEAAWSALAPHLDDGWITSALG